MAGVVVDLVLVYSFIKRLSTPFREWKAYELGVIDEKGELLKKRSELTREQRAAWGYFDVLVRNVKRLIEKLPGGSSKIATAAAAMLLLREGPEALTRDRLVEEVAVATNNAGSGRVAGIGVGPDGEPPGRTRRVRRRLRDVVDPAPENK